MSARRCPDCGISLAGLHGHACPSKIKRLVIIPVDRWCSDNWPVVFLAGGAWMAFLDRIWR